METLNTSGYGFPDGNLMIRQNSADFAKAIAGVFTDSSSTPFEISDAKDWLSKNSQFAQTYNQISQASTDVSLIGSVFGQSQSNSSGSDTSSDSSSSTGSSFWDGLWKPVQKWGVAFIAIVIGLVLLAGAIYTYHNK